MKKTRELNYSNIIDNNSKDLLINDSIEKIDNNNIYKSESRKMNYTN
jgi:hypothetical protein